MEYTPETVSIISSCIQAASTVVLVVVTVWYAVQTRKQAQSSAEQIQFMKDSAQAEQQQYAQALESFAAGLRDVVGFKLTDNIPVPGNDLLAFSALRESDITELRLLSRRVGGKTTNLAVKASAALRVLYEMIQEVKNRPELHRKNSPGEYSPMEKKNWTKARQDSARELAELESECQRVSS